MGAPKNYSVKILNDADEQQVLELMVSRFRHLPKAKARRAARELVALRKFNNRIAEAAI